MQFHRGETDGVRTVWREEAGPLTAWLRFGVGRNEERLAESGITHAVEHLALVGIGPQPYTWNGTVDGCSMNFWVSGEPAEVRSFLATVCSALASLPSRRVLDELRVMQVEESRKKPSQLGHDLALRYGACGPGLMERPEFGLLHLRADRIQAWADQWCTSDNAVLVVRGTPPDGLTLPLPRGNPPDRRELSASSLHGRTWSAAQTDRVSLSVVGANDPAVVFGLEVTRERTFERLRTDLAVTYATTFTPVQLDATRWLLQLTSDGRSDKAGTILRTMAEVLEEVTRAGPTMEELERTRARWQRYIATDQGLDAALQGEAICLLYDLPVRGPDDRQAQVQALTPDQVGGAVATTLDTLVAVGPRSLGGARPGWREPPKWSGAEVTGVKLSAVPEYTDGRLVIGNEGVSWVRNALQRRTVRWDSLAACLAWDDGKRTLVGDDGTEVVVSPWEWVSETVPGITETVDRYVDPARRVPLGAGKGEPPVTHVAPTREVPTAVPAVAGSASAPRGWSPTPARQRSVLMICIPLLVVASLVLAATIGAVGAVITVVLVVVIVVPLTQWVMRRRRPG